MHFVMFHWLKKILEVNNNNGACAIRGMAYSLFQNLILTQACDYGVPECVMKAKQLYSSWRENDTVNPWVVCLQSHTGSLDHPGPSLGTDGSDFGNKSAISLLARSRVWLNTMELNADFWLFLIPKIKTLLENESNTYSVYFLRRELSYCVKTLKSDLIELKVKELYKSRNKHQ